MRYDIRYMSYLDLTDGVSVIATAEVPPPAPTPDPGQTVPVAGPTGLVVPPVCPGVSSFPLGTGRVSSERLFESE